MLALTGGGTDVTQQPQSPVHPILGCAADITAAVKAVRDVQPVFMTPADKQAAVVELARAAAALDELRLRVLTTCDDLADAAAARDVGSWAATVTLSDRGAARADAALAVAVDARWRAVGEGMRDGAVSLAQARVVVEALEALPADLDPALVADAQTHLVGLCAEFPPADLRRLGRRILEVVAPDVAEAEEAQRLERLEQAAREKASVRTRRLGDGVTRTTILHPDAEADRFLTYLDAFTNPRKHPDAVSGEEDRIPHHRRRGHAFGALLEHLDPANLPEHGGDATTVLVTIPLESLTKDLATAQLLTGTDLSAGEARRQACTAKIIPVVLGGDSEVLDLGRARRLFSPAQRKALRLRDRRCRAEGCDVPAAWCEAHHLKPWAEGGTTNLDDGICACNYHHHRLHDHHYTHELLPNGDIRFHRRT